jgi:hypothetical protein
MMSHLVTPYFPGLTPTIKAQRQPYTLALLHAGTGFLQLSRSRKWEGASLAMINWEICCTECQQLQKYMKDKAHVVGGSGKSRTENKRNVSGVGQSV